MHGGAGDGVFELSGAHFDATSALNEGAGVDTPHSGGMTLHDSVAASAMNGFERLDASGSGQLRVQQANGNAYVTGDVNGDGVADFGFSVATDTLVAKDFLL